ncbi:MAG: LpxD N-terminal domain-containing protein, partial [Bacteroidota bacterium]
MRLKTPITAAALAVKIGAELIGDGSVLITGINEIHHVEPGDICFVDFAKYYDATLASAASVILIDQTYPCPPGKALLLLPEPFTAFNRIMLEERPERAWSDAVHPTAVIGAGTLIGPGAAVGANARIGERCRIGANAVIADGVHLGDRVDIGAGAVIGEEAFYFKRKADGMTTLRSGGSVYLANDVSVGPNSTIARGVSAITTIGTGSKLDAQVQIGHDCRIGKHCLLAAQVGIAGNTTVGDWCVFQGQVGIAQNLVIGDRCIILAKSGVSKDLEGGKA